MLKLTQTVHTVHANVSLTPPKKTEETELCSV